MPNWIPARRPPEPDARWIVSVDDASAVLALVNAPSGAARGTLLLLHGLGGSADAVYMRRTAAVALSRGWWVVRMNLRTCGGTEAISRTLYNAGQAGDAGSVLAELTRRNLPRPHVAAGFSLGGNLALLHAGLAGEDCLADAVAGVNPPLDLTECIRALERPSNALFQAYFTLLLCAQVRRVRRVRPVAGPPAWPWSVRGVRAFDERFTAPDAGHPDAEAYYRAASAGPSLAGSRVPTLVLTSRNDPFVPVESIARWARGGRAEMAVSERGGHVGYRQEGRPGFWAAEAVLAWFEARTRRGACS